MIPYVVPSAVNKIIQNIKNLQLNPSPIERQVIPSENENLILDVELSDPLGGKSHAVSEHFIHQYKNRCLLLTTSNCFGYCRYCFRNNFTCNKNDEPDENELETICSYLSRHDEIQEILFSGGDPLMLPDNKLFALIEKIRSVRPEILIRICTRALFYAPERFTQSLISHFRSLKPLWIIPHINHFYEIDSRTAPQAVSAINSILDGGISMQSQTVLLRGINDDVKTLSVLFEELTKLGIKPGYLFQTDLAQGTSHFRVPMDEACNLYYELRHELSGLSLPTFAVDLPGGGGKFNLLQLPCSPSGAQVSAQKDYYEFKKDDGIFRYPR
ncbi:MAG: KamA family radical SAM protein [Treponemataceae bacterium]|nr:KamA family radical SAM protein [Treponemataceae bacterium]